MADRVDKQWKDKGLGGYSTASIIGTLNHYGVKLDEAGIKKAGEDKSPLELAAEWKGEWKGTGQFLSYPYAAANELLMRMYPDRPTPMKVATIVMELIAQGLRAVDGKEADLGGPFSAFDAVSGKLPAVGDARDGFLREFVGFIEAWATPFNDLPERLTKAGRKDDGHRFALVQETLFPDRAGCVTSLVRAASGERDAAVKDLFGWAGEATRDLFARYAALDALYQLEAWPEVKSVGLAVFDAAAEQEKWVVGDSIAHLLAHMLQKIDRDPALTQEVERRLALAHEKTGGHHH